MIRKNETINTDVRLPLRTKHGYGAASIADTVVIDYVSSYFLFFLTDIVGIKPSLAGTVLMLGVLWDAVTDPVIGKSADDSHAPGGKYRRYVLLSIAPILITLILLFTKVSFPGMGGFIYYVIIALMYYTAYTVFNIPYMALGSSLTSNDSEKTKLSGIRQSYGYAGAIFACAMPAWLIDYFRSKGIEYGMCYTVTAVLLGLISALTIFITWRSTKGYELEFPKPEKKISLIKSIKTVMSCKSFMLLIGSALLFYTGCNMYANGVLYAITGILGFTESAAGGVYLVLSVVGLIMSYVLAGIAEKVDKKIVYVICVTISTAYMIYVKFAGIDSLTDYYIYTVMTIFCEAAFLVFIYNFLYDVIDVLELKTGVRDSGTTFAYYSFVIKCGKALGLQLIGIILDMGGYNPDIAVQEEAGKNAILNVITL